MNDAVYEHMVPRKGTPKDMVVRIAVIMFLVFLMIIGMGLIGSLAFALVLLLGFLAHTFIFTRLNVEFEYTVLNHDIDVDAIYSRAKRKRQLSFDIQKAELVCPNKSPRAASRKPEKIYDFSGGQDSKDTYAVYMNLNTKNICILMDFDQGMIDHVRPWMGSKFHTD